jgi:hypothetical protein
LGHNL